MTGSSLAAFGPVFDVDGVRIDDLAQHCVGLQITEEVDGPRTCAGRFLHPLDLDRAGIALGSHLEVTFGPAGQHTVFEGYVFSLERALDDGSPPVDVVVAEKHQRRTEPTHAAPDMTFTWGRDLLTARLREEMRHGSRIDTVSGGATHIPDLVVGSRVTLEGVGAPFDGAGYSVTGVTHTFDLRQGFRTRFSAERPTPTRSEDGPNTSEEMAR